MAVISIPINNLKLMRGYQFGFKKKLKLFERSVLYCANMSLFCFVFLFVVVKVHSIT